MEDPSADYPTRKRVMNQQLNDAEELHPLTAEEFKEVERKLREYLASKPSSVRRTSAYDKKRCTDVRRGKGDEVNNSSGPKGDK